MRFNYTDNFDSYLVFRVDAPDYCYIKMSYLLWNNIPNTQPIRCNAPKSSGHCVKCLTDAGEELYEHTINSTIRN